MASAGGLPDMLVAGHLSPCERVAVKPSADMWEQWEHSQHIIHPLIEPPHVEAAIKQTVQAAQAR